MTTQATATANWSRAGTGPDYLWSLASITITNAGAGYTAGSITFAAGGSTAATLTFAGGTVSGYSITNSGARSQSGAPSSATTISAPNVTPVNNTDLQAVSGQLGLGGNMLNAANKTYIDSNTGQAFTTASNPDLVRLSTLVQE